VNVTVGILIALGFALKELGEAKYKIAGSIRDISKNIDMLEMVFTVPEVIVQWSVPGIVAFAVFYVVKK
jgi:hypothetical protein